MGKDDPDRWYCICFVCNAKFFSENKVCECPRCGASIRSRGHCRPPWQQKKCGDDGSDAVSNLHADLSREREGLLRTIAHALRHAPEQYYLEMDSGGWVDIQHLLLALQYQRRRWLNLTSSDLRKVIGKSSDSSRFEVKGNRIRASYGHSVDVPELSPAAFPPHILYHGTCGTLLEVIRAEGLRPMGRSRVQLSSNWKYSHTVARTKATQPIVLSVQASAAADSGVMFWKCNSHAWLADSLPAQFIASSNGT
jgi:putative RNA 2'-phosphotransferase